ncbi:Transmembrane domain-containing protein [Cedratvirus Zaza IHUMI]|uniref:Transmembrane domain-containing protein n=1 Tax=Cedratvirus Zaza IHUMI TaxID=2126979 RepID=A0A2R8FDP3_9VIRU|nr:Transmembrane domain-containing protein [Cedratvirus Zaza IHUMI]
MRQKLITFLCLSFAIFVISFALGFYRGREWQGFDLIASLLLPLCFLLQAMVLLF